MVQPSPAVMNRDGGLAASLTYRAPFVYASVSSSVIFRRKYSSIFGPY